MDGDQLCRFCLRRDGGYDWNRCGGWSRLDDFSDNLIFHHVGACLCTKSDHWNLIHPITSRREGEPQMTSKVLSQITFLNTTDLAGTADFYEEVLGLELALDQGSCRIYAICEGAFIGFCHRKTHPNPDGVILTLVTHDVDGWYDTLSSRGVHFEEQPSLNIEYQIYHCFLRDPNGYLVEIQRFEDPRWHDSEKS